MPSLRMTKGEWPEQVYRLDRDVTVIGKGPDCDIVLPDKHVSTMHARIVRRTDGLYIEDLNSTNETKVGRRELERVTAPRRLMDGDEIKICKYRFAYVEGEPSPGESLTILESIDVLTAVGRSPTGSNSGEKLRVIEEICGELVGVLDLDSVLEKVLEALFRVFPQAERAFLDAPDMGTQGLAIRASRFRRPGPMHATPSRTVSNLVTESGRAILCADIGADSRLAEIDSLRESGVRTILCVPLWDHERRAVGVLQLDAEDRNGRFTQEDLDFLVALATTISMAVENARLHELAVRLQQWEQDGRDAWAVQDCLIPNRYPVVPDYAFWHHYRPARCVGGDYFDYCPLRGPGDGAAARPARLWAIAVGDVSGKGMAAALLMAGISSEVRLLLREETEPGRTLVRLNRSLCERIAGERFVTFLLAVLDGEQHELTVFNAGHPWPMIRRAGGSLELIGEGRQSLPLGIQEDVDYRAVTTVIGLGDVVVLCTDGVTEAMSPHRETFGFPGLGQSLAGAPAGVVAVGEAILADVRRHAAGGEPNDDLTLLCFGRS